MFSLNFKPNDIELTNPELNEKLRNIKSEEDRDRLNSEYGVMDVYDGMMSVCLKEGCLPDDLYPDNLEECYFHDIIEEVYLNVEECFWDFIKKTQCK